MEVSAHAHFHSNGDKINFELFIKDMRLKVIFII